VNLKLISGILAGLLGVICFVPYLRDIFKKETTPHSYSWLIWAILQTIGVVAIIVGHGGYYGTLGIAAGALFCLTIFLLSLKYGTKNITKLDTFSFVMALVAILIWVFTKTPLYSVILISLIDFIGFIPTMRKGYEQPETETASTFFIASISNVFALLALSAYSISTTLYLCSLIFTNTLFVIILLYRRTKLHKLY
jgi:uncharacterized membrane protein